MPVHTGAEPVWSKQANTRRSEARARDPATGMWLQAKMARHKTMPTKGMQAQKAETDTQS